MPKYQSVKLTFDLEDEHQLKLYNHLKKRTNGSSYIRSLIHSDINGVHSSPKQYYLSNSNEEPKNIIKDIPSEVIQYEVVKEQNNEEIIIDGLF